MSDRTSFLKTWWIAVRPFAFPASTMPVVFGTVLAVTVGGAAFNVPLFLVALAGMVLLHAGSNILSDVRDFQKGLDTEPLPVSGAIVRGLMDTRTALAGSLVMLAAGVACGLAVAAFVGWPIVAVGCVGVLLGVLYSTGPAALKYNALGDLTVFLNFGILGALGAWTVQTGSLSWIPAVWTIPSALLVAGILHANNWRDIPGDRACGIRTVASILGDRLSAFYYGVLIFGPFAFVVAFVLVTHAANADPVMPFTFLVTLVALPLAVSLMKRALRRAKPERALDFATLDGATAQLNLAFGLLATAALVLNRVVG
jgi:1,4-dihydroxy-2-naphthoate octaprenyltransferase